MDTHIRRVYSGSVFGVATSSAIRALSPLALAGLTAAAGCTGQPAPMDAHSTPDAAASGHECTTLADGEVDVPAAGTYYASIFDVKSDLEPTPPRAHPASMYYTIDGQHVIELTDGTRLTMNAGEGGFTADGVPHTHINPGPATNDWWALSVGSSSQRAASPPVPGSTWVYQSADFDMSGGPHSLSLIKCELKSGGIGPLERHAGEAFLVTLSGTVQVEIADQAPQSLIRESGSHISSGTEYRTTAPAEAASYLLFQVTPEVATPSRSP